MEGFLSFVTGATDLVIPNWVVSYYLLLVISQEPRCKGIWPYRPLLQAKTTQLATCWFEVLEDYGLLALYDEVLSYKYYKKNIWAKGA